MTYWRMQVHPSSPSLAIKYTIESLAAGYIGLDFLADVGDMLVSDQSVLPARHKDYWSFAHEMKEGDLVLVVAHHYPFALTQIAGPYNYIRAVAPEIGVWFKHFRKVDDVRYYADFKTNPQAWTQTTMTDTISPLRNPDSISYRLIEEWSRS